MVYDGGYGAVYNFCNYNWAVDCGKRVYDDTPISSPGCLYQYGLYPVGVGCQTTFYKVTQSGLKSAKNSWNHFSPKKSAKKCNLTRKMHTVCLKG